MQIWGGFYWRLGEPFLWLGYLRITCCLWGEKGGGGWDFLRDLGVAIKTAETLGNEGLEKVFGLLKGSRALRLTRVAESLVIRQYFILASSRPPSPSF